MQKYNLSPNQLLVVDDMKLACQMASPVGVPVAFAGWGKRDFVEIYEEMQQLCQYSFKQTEELYRFLFE